jgi:hypothetical protein
LLQEAGLQAYGTEWGEAAVEDAGRAGFRVQRVFPQGEEVVLEHAPFQAFASFNFMEHWPRPREVWRCVSRHLADGAIGLVEVPDFDMIVRQRLLTEFITDHLMYFTRDTFSRALQICGFDVLQLSSVWQGYILSAVVRKRPRLCAQGFLDWQAQAGHSLQRFVRAHQSRGVAVWGAGHQALATLALFQLQDGVRYVVDSAPFKQGRYTPSSHLRICAPEQLLQAPVGAVLVMVAAYAPEVVQRIEREFIPQWRAMGVEPPVVAVWGEEGLSCTA